jgi:hypothetical protein
MKKAKASSKDKMHPMLHGQHDGKMPKEMMGMKEPKGKLMKAKKKTAKKKK